jgi:hypothetical protein
MTTSAPSLAEPVNARAFRRSPQSAGKELG